MTHAPLRYRPAPLIQRRADPASPAPSLAPMPPLGTGAPLPDSLRAPMETGFSRDFGAVRIHDDARAHDGARALGARAFAAGNDIVFGAGHYRPETTAGRALIAHELAHVVQQGGMQMKPEGPLHASADQRLEAEADTAARAIDEGRPAPALSRLGRPAIQRAAEDEPAAAGTATPAADPAAQKLPPGMTAIEDEPKGIGTKSLAIEVASFTLPAPKGSGPWVQAAHDEAAAGGRTAFTPQYVNGRIGAFKETVASSTYTGMWLNNFGFSTSKALAEAVLTSSDKDVKAALMKDEMKALVAKLEKAVDKSVGSAGCNIDHIVEKQMGGVSIPSNLQILDKDLNQQSGRKTYDALRELVTEVQKPEYRGPKVRPKQFILREVKVPAGQADAPVMLETLLRKKGAIAGDAGLTAQAAGKPVTLKAGGFGETVNIRDSGTTPVSDRGRFLIPGMALAEYRRGGRGKNGGIDSVTAELRHPAVKTAAGRGDIVLDAQPDSGGAPVGAAAAGAAAEANAAASEMRLLKIRSEKPKSPVKFSYPYLSPGELTRIWLDDKGAMNAVGTIRPSLPLLPKLDIEMGPETLKLVAPINAEKLNPPIAFFRFTSGDLSLQLAPEFVPSGKLEFEVGPKAKPVVRGELKAWYEAGAFIFKGTMVPARPIPGVSAASGKVMYRSDSGWSGKLKAQTSAIPRSVLDLELGFLTEGGRMRPYGKGGLTTQLREDTQMQLGADWNGGAVSMRGEATMLKPMKFIDKVTLKGSYAEEVLNLSGEADFKWRSIDSKMAVFYRRKDGEEGKFWGKADIALKTEKLGGMLNLNFDADGNFWGAGTVSYQLTKDIRPELGVKYEKGRFLMSGKVALADMRLGKQWPSEEGGKLSIIKGIGVKFNVPTPVPAVTAFIELRGSLGLGYGAGPLILRGVIFEGSLYPLEDDPKVTAKLKGSLVLPAYGTLYGTFGAYIGAEVALGAVGVKGGVDISPSLTIRGEAGINVDADYDAEGFSFGAEAYAKGTLTAAVALDLSATISVAYGIYSHKWVHEGPRFSRQIGPEMMLRLGRVGYAKNGEITWPKLSDIKAEPESIDTKAVVADFLGMGKAKKT